MMRTVVVQVLVTVKAVDVVVVMKVAARVMEWTK
jgi:hypothetical protein